MTENEYSIVFMFVFFRYDLIDLTRQVLSKLANQVHIDTLIAFRRKDIKAFDLHSQKFLQLIKDIDVLLASDDNFLLGTWVESAKKLAVNPSEMRQVRTNSFSSRILKAFFTWKFLLFFRLAISLEILNLMLSSLANIVFYGNL